MQAEEANVHPTCPHQLRPSEGQCPLLAFGLDQVRHPAAPMRLVTLAGDS